MNFSTVVRSLAWSGLESWGISMLLLFTAIVLARILGPEDFGIASLAMGLTLILQVVAERLFHDAIIQRADLQHLHLDTAFSASLCVAATLVTGVWLISPALADLYDEPRLSGALRLSSLCLLFNGASGVLIAYLRRQMKFKVLAIRTLAGALIGTVAGLVMAINGFGLWSLIGQQVLHTCMAMVVVFLSIDRLPRLRFSKAHLRDLFGYSTIVVASDVIWNANLRVFMAVLGYLVGPVAVGYFEVASRVVDSIRNIWLNAINPVALSAFSKLQTSASALKEGFHSATEINASIAIPVFAGLFVTATELVPTILGESWIAATPIIQLMSLAALFSSIRQFPPIIFNAVGRPHYNLIGATVGLIAPNLALLVLTPASLMAQGAIWVGRLALTIPMGFWFTYKTLSLTPRRQVKGVGAPMAAALVMVLILSGLKTTLLADMADLQTLALQVAMGSLIYFPILIFFSPHLIESWNRTIKEIRAR